MADGATPTERIHAVIPAFDPPINGLSIEQRVALGLAHRAADLADGVHVLAPQSATTASIVLRSLIDLLILVRWIEIRPRLHARLWLLEDERARIRAVDALQRSIGAHGRRVPDAYSPTVRHAAHRRFDRMRRFARSRGVRPAPRSLLPSVRQRSSQVFGLDSELYGAGFEVLSPVTHTAGMSFVTDLVDRPDGKHLRLRPLAEELGTHTMADSILCGVLASVSRQLGLGHETELDAIRLELVTRPEFG